MSAHCTTLQNSNTSECPQRKSALVALELARLDVDIAALSESDAECRLFHGPPFCPDEAEHPIKMVKKDVLPRAKKLNVDRLADVREHFILLLEADLRKPQDDDSESNMSQLKTILQDVTTEVVGYCSKPNSLMRIMRISRTGKE
ncbi:craniofacial development protein 2 [Biomphalaria glabrata]|nr:craniofacial development protein 2 [Biomphalaria glabrata]